MCAAGWLCAEYEALRSDPAGRGRAAVVSCDCSGTPARRSAREFREYDQGHSATTACAVVPANQQPSNVRCAGPEDDAALDPSPAVNPAVDRQLDALWAESIRRRVVEHLEVAYRERGKAGLFARIQPLLEGRKPGQTYAQIAAELGVAEPVINVEVMRLRDRFRKEFREEVGQTVNAPAQLDEEFRYLLSLLFTSANG